MKGEIRFFIYKFAQLVKFRYRQKFKITMFAPGKLTSNT